MRVTKPTANGNKVNAMGPIINYVSSDNPALQMDTGIQILIRDTETNTGIQRWIQRRIQIEIQGYRDEYRYTEMDTEIQRRIQR